MLSFFNACLQVNKLDRAALVLERFSGMPGVMPDSELILYHNRYLRAHLDRAFEQTNDSWAQSLHKWFELEIRGKNLPHTPETIACMLKVSILSSRGDKLHRLVYRYMDMVSQDTMYEVLADEEILTQQDLGTITSIYTPASELSFEGLQEGSEETGALPLDNGLNDAAPGPSASESSKIASSDTPQVREVEQKGLGLKTLRSVLSFFDDIQGKDLSQLSVDERREVQARLEKDCVDAAIKRWRQENEALQQIGRNTAISSKALNSQLYEWHRDLEGKIKRELELLEKAEAASLKTAEEADRCLYGPFMKQTNPDRLAAVTILSVLNTIAQRGPEKGITLTLMLQNLAKAVEEDNKQLLREKANPYGKKKGKGRKRVVKPKQSQSETGKVAEASAAEAPAAEAPAVEASAAEAPAAEASATEVSTTESLTAEAAAELLAAESSAAIETTQDGAEGSAQSETPENIIECSAYDTESWPPLVRTKVGVALLEMLLDSAKVNVVREHPETKMLINQVQPAMAHTMMLRKGRKIGIILPNKWLVDVMKSEPRGDFLARHLPMLVEPEPWTKFDKGGFVSFPAQLIRIKNGEKDQRIYAEAAAERGDMEQVSKGLDVLGKTAWQINKPVFDTILEAWNTGEEIANIPPLNPDIPVPPEPAPSADMMHRRAWLRDVKIAENEKSGLHSERCFINFQLEIARAFKDQTFYFPHNMDFRGRAYPLPTYLNHMGADHTRGLLRFAVGRELGENGLKWLKVHLANVFGFDKASLKEREAFTTENLPHIYESANNPLKGSRWWLQAEDPWQCLAACFEVKAALDSPDPTKFVSHLPVHQDGTCNGLQHYAALGGDRWGAQQVNLVPGDRPADVYSAVADLVKADVAEDLKKDSFLAKAVDGKITRKVVKQTVMTNVYGVTFIGARAQVLKQLDSAHPNLQKETDVPSLLLASYIATKIFRALSTMFRGAHDIQYWLGECAGRVCRSLTPEQLARLAEGPVAAPDRKTKNPRVSSTKKSKAANEDILNSFRSTIVWTTPLRMPVVQPYRKAGTRVVETSLQDLNLQIPERSDPVNRRKQLQGFPPNFIHSLDASHMLLSALECDELGLTFAAVHDSFWTHAADVDVMNRVLRDAFVRIHGEDVIGRLASEFQARYKGSLYLSDVDPGSQLATAVRDLRKQKKMTMRDELLAEWERQKLLHSDKPEDVEKGQAMVTPASLFESIANEPSSVSSNSEMNEVALGHIPNIDEATQPVLPEDGSDEAQADEPNEHISRGEDGELVKSMMSVSQFEMKLTGVGKRKQSGTVKQALQIWLPLTLPEIPKKVGSCCLYLVYLARAHLTLP